MTLNPKTLIVTATLCCLTALSAMAQLVDTLLPEEELGDGQARYGYSAERPLIYEGAQDLWPYSFLNEKGQADGYNIDLIRLLLGKLGIPYRIHMKPRMVAFRDLKEGRSDLMIGLTAGFHEDYGYYSTNAVTLFTQSILSPKDKPTEVRNFRDLANHRVYVNDSSLCHHLMVDYGWGDNAIPTRNIGETILKMSTDGEGELVWNTLSLKWLLRKYQITNLQITPVDMPHGEYKFMSGDAHLIHLLDSVFTELNTNGELQPLQSRWFYPDREENATPRWVNWVGATVAFLLVLLVVYMLNYRIQAARITRENTRRNRRLALILETNGMRLWTYDIKEKMFTWRNEFGQPAYVYTQDEFATRYTPEDYRRLTAALGELSAQRPSDDGEEREISLNIRAKDAREDGDTEMHDFIIALSVLRRDRQGNATVIIGTKKDVSEKCRLQRLDDERTLRYQALFSMPTMAILFFDKEGTLVNLNQKACQLYCCEHDDIIARRMSYHELLGLDHLQMADADGFYASFIMDPDRMPPERKAQCACHLRGRLYNEFHLITVDDEENEGQLLGMFAVCRDVTPVAEAIARLDAAKQRYEEVKAREESYVTTLDDFIRNGSIRLVSYSPASHTFTIFDTYNHVQQTLTQMRVMTLVESSLRKKTLHIISNMDQRDNHVVETELKTSLRLKGRALWVYVHLLPQTDAQGNVSEYLGILRDISEMKDIETQLAAVEARTQEVEHTKNSFVKNMMHEIRTPLNTIISNANDLRPDTVYDDDVHDATTQTIIANAEQLTHIIDNILTLSRIEAHMVEIARRPTDLAPLFASLCEKGWGNNRVPGVRYLVENPYEQLVLDIDIDHLGDVITQVALNAAQHTRSGAIRARYEYIGRRLIITFEDTGEGIDPQRLAAINAQLESGIHSTSGLGLPISKELLSQMGGNLEISSEPAVGTAVWITLPCSASSVKRKKMQ